MLIFTLYSKGILIKIVQAILIRQKTRPPGGGAYFPYISILKTIKIFLSETTGLIAL